MFNFWPVIVREVRSASRQPTSYWIRLTAVALTLLIFFLIWFGAQLPPQQLGRQLFNTMSLSMFCGIWIIAPLLSADCISREKRDGTLGLLFLTPLKAFDIVVAKIIAQALRSGTMLVAAIPALLLPVLIGGVSWMDGLRAVLINLSALFIALAIGVVASTFCKRWMMAVITSLVISISIACLFVWVYLLARRYESFLNGSVNFWDYAFDFRAFYAEISSRMNSLLESLKTTDDFAFYSGYSAAYLWRGRVGNSVADLSSIVITGSMLILSLLGIVCVLFFAAARLNHFWKDHPTSKRQLWLLKVFCSTLFWKDKLKSGLNRKLDTSPLLWLYSYSWRTRMIKWAWFLAVMLAEVFIFNAYLESLYGGPTLMTNQFLLSSVITIGLAFTAVNSFRMERQNGSLELLLTTPLQEAQLINGRLYSLCRHFLPTVILVAVVCIVSSERYLIAFIFNWIVTLFAVTCIGLWLSLTRLNQMSAWCITIVVTLLVPQLLLYYFFANDNWSSEFGRVFGSAQSRGSSIAIIQIFMGFEALRRAKRKLVSRTF